MMPINFQGEGEVGSEKSKNVYSNCVGQCTTNILEVYTMCTS